MALLQHSLSNRALQLPCPSPKPHSHARTPGVHLGQLRGLRRADLSWLEQELLFSNRSQRLSEEETGKSQSQRSGLAGTGSPRCFPSKACELAVPRLKPECLQLQDKAPFPFPSSLSTLRVSSALSSSAQTSLPDPGSAGT